MTMSLKPQNILCQRISESEVVPVVCDNLGESTFIPLATWSTWCCERKLERVWQRFIAQYFSRSLMACAYQARTTQIAGRIRRSRRHSTKLIKLVARHKRFPTQLAHLAHNPRLPATHIAVHAENTIAKLRDIQINREDALFAPDSFNAQR